MQKLDPKPSLYLKGFYFLNFLSFSFTRCKTEKAIHGGVRGVKKCCTILWRTVASAPQKFNFLGRILLHAPQKFIFLWPIWTTAH